MDRTRRVNAGEKIRIHHETWNEVVAATVAARKGGATGGPLDLYVSREWIRVRNDTGSALPFGAIVALNEPLIDPADNEGQFLKRVAFGVGAPGAGTDAKFAVLIEPIPAGVIGRAVCDGTAICKVRYDGVSAKGYAEVRSGSTVSLDNVATGTCAVLWMADSGDANNDRWAVVRLGDNRVAPVITVGAVDGSPSLSDTNTILFDEVDGFSVSSSASGIARVDMAVADTTQVGIVSTTNQEFGGPKGFETSVAVHAHSTWAGTKAAALFIGMAPTVDPGVSTAIHIHGHASAGDIFFGYGSTEHAANGLRVGRGSGFMSGTSVPNSFFLSSTDDGDIFSALIQPGLGISFGSQMIIGSGYDAGDATLYLTAGQTLGIPTSRAFGIKLNPEVSTHELSFKHIEFVMYVEAVEEDEDTVFYSNFEARVLSLYSGTSATPRFVINGSPGVSGTLKLGASVTGGIITGLGSNNTEYAIPIGDGSGGFGYASPGTSGGVLMSNGASANPSFQALTDAHISTGIDCGTW